MKNTRFFFRAWIPAIQTMLYEVAVYMDGMIGICPENFEGQLNPAYEFDGDQVHTKLSEDGMGGFDLVKLNIMTGDEWLFFDYDDIILMQHTGRKDADGNDIWEGDISQYTVPPFTDPPPVGDPNVPSESITYTEVVQWGLSGFDLDAIPLYAALDFNLRVIGNIHEQPELITQ